MNSVGKQNTFWLALILGTSLLFGAFSLCGSMPTFAYGAPAESAQTGGSAQAQDANASTAFQDVFRFSRLPPGWTVSGAGRREYAATDAARPQCHAGIPPRR